MPVAGHAFPDQLGNRPVSIPFRIAFDLGKQVLKTSFLISLAFLRFIGHPVLHRLFQIQGEATLSDQPVWFGRLGRSAFPFFTLLSFTFLFFTFLSLIFYNSFILTYLGDVLC